MKNFLLLMLVCLGIAPAVWADDASQQGSLLADAVTSRVSLPGDVQVDGVRVSEISGLAWDPQTEALHAVSDRGHLFRFRIERDNGMLRAVVPVSVERLRHPGAGRDPADRFDAEGLALRPVSTGAQGSVELLVSTEGTPKVWRVNADGTVQGALTLPADLADARHYQARNTMLEAVAVHPLHGWLVAPERPQRDDDPKQGHRIHAADRHWTIPALDPMQSHLKAMDVTETGHLLVLERSGRGKRLVNALRRADLAGCDAPGPCAVETLLQMERDNGAENFEGMAYLGNGVVVLVSDNGGKKDRDTVFLLVDLSGQVIARTPKK